MKQLLQSYRTGRLRLVDVPPDAPKQGHLTVRTMASLVSIGTEKYLLELARKSLLGKALERPDLVRQVIAKAQSEGILEAWRQAVSRLDIPVPVGYSSAGLVLDVGPGVEGFSVGQRVACAGSGYASHAEVVSVPALLCVKIPEPLDRSAESQAEGDRVPRAASRGVTFENAAFVALGAVALQAVRMARVSLGETVVAIGLGLLGQIAVQLLNAAGCHVIGMDVDPQKADLARQHGADAVASDFQALLALCRLQTAHQGADAVLIFAATPSNEPLEQAAELCRERGRIVATGLIGLEVPRKPFYEKELELIISRAWGPGLYDSNYTEKGLDYPVAYARWTAKRNMEEFLAQLTKGKVSVDHLITHRFTFDRAAEAYNLILEGSEPHIGVVLTYPAEVQEARPAATIWLKQSGRAASDREGLSKVDDRKIGVGLIGAGQFAAGTMLPALRGLNRIRLRGVATTTGRNARHTAEKYGFDYCTTNTQEILNDTEIGLVFILTRHGSHAQLVAEALRADKHVFVEKPLALNVRQLRDVVRAYQLTTGGWKTLESQLSSPVAPHLPSTSGRQLMVGLNRRFSPFTTWLKERFAGIAEPLAVHCTVNAGPVPPEHWVHDPEQGGGRIIGEVCHFVDLIQYLTGSLPARVYAETLGSGGYKASDNVVVTLKMSNGSISSITYVSGGEKRYPRERVEVFGGSAVGVIENFKAATFTRRGRTQRTGNWLSVDRGHRGEIQVLVDVVRKGGAPPVSFEEYIYTSLATFGIEDSLRQGVPIIVDTGVLRPVDAQ